MALVALPALALTGCGQEETNGSGASPTPAAQATPTAVPATVQTEITPTSGSENGGLALDIQVTQFSVAANFEIRGQFNVLLHKKLSYRWFHFNFSDTRTG